MLDAVVATCSNAGVRPATAALLLLFAACDCGGGDGDDGTTSPQLMVVPPVVDFGQITLGLSARVPLELTNPGGTVIRILRAYPDEALANEIRIEAVPAALLPSTMATVDVIFSPMTAGTRSGEIHFDLGDVVVSIPVVGNVGDPSLVVRPENLDFGRIVLGKVASATVTLTNEGTGAVKISALTLDMSTSSEFVVQLDTSRSLAAGESFDFIVRYVPGDRGIDRGRVVIADDANRPERVSVAVTGEGITSELTVEPTVLDFSGTIVGQLGHAELEVRNVGATTQMVTGVRVVDAGPDANFFLSRDGPQTPIAIAAGAITRLDIVFEPRVPGFAVATLLIESPGLLAPFPVELTALAALSPTPIATISPSAVEFGLVATQHATPRRITIQNDGALPFTVAQVPRIEPASAPFFVTDWPAASMRMAGQESHTFTVSAQPTMVGTGQAELVFETTIAEQFEVRVPLAFEARAAPTPSLLLEADQLRFGSVERGDSVEQRLDVRSAGDAPVTLSAATIEGGGGRFSAAFTPGMVAPGERSAIRVTYTDPLGVVQTSTATLVVESDGDPATKRIALRATTVSRALVPPDLEVRLTWSAPDADLDLHLIRDTGSLFDRPHDCCFCNPSPTWSLIGMASQNPIHFGDSADGDTGETIRLPITPDASFRLVVHAVSSNVGPVEATVAVYSAGMAIDVVRRTVVAERAWEVGRVEVASGAMAFDVQPSDVPLAEERRDRCF